MCVNLDCLLLLQETGGNQPIYSHTKWIGDTPKCPNPKALRSKEGGAAEKGFFTTHSNKALIARIHQILTPPPSI